MRAVTRILSVTLSAALVVGALPAQVAFASAPAPDLAEAQALYQQGRRSYEVKDYEKALELWKQAYQMLPETEENAGAIRHALVFNMADAETKQYEIDQDAARLRKARLLLQEYIETHALIYGEGEDAREDRENAERRLAELEDRIASLEGRAPPSAATAPAPTGPVGPTPAQLRRNEIDANPDLKALDRKYTGFIAGGATMMAVGSVVSLVGLGIGLANLGGSAIDLSTGEETDTRPFPRFTGLAVTVVGVGLIGGGIPLVAIGDTRRRNLRNPAQPLPDTSRVPRLAPYANRHGGGASLQMRF